MAPMLLIKLPFILSAATGLQFTLTPPSASQPSRNVKATGMEKPAPWMPLVYRTLLWSITLPEIAVILATSCPSPISAPILSALVHGHDSVGIQVTPLFFVACLASLCGSLIRCSCYIELGSFFTFQLGIQKNHKLITTGPYSIVRHPSYTGGALAVFGIALCHFSRGSWLVECSGLFPECCKWKVLIWVWVINVVIIGISLRRRMQEEDEMLRLHFRTQWQEWARKVPYSMIPGVY